MQNLTLKFIVLGSTRFRDCDGVIVPPPYTESFKNRFILRFQNMK